MELSSMSPTQSRMTERDPEEKHEYMRKGLAKRRVQSAVRPMTDYHRRLKMESNKMADDYGEIMITNKADFIAAVAATEVG